MSQNSSSSPLSSSTSSSMQVPPVVPGVSSPSVPPISEVNSNAQEVAQKRFTAEDVAHTKSGTVWAKRIGLAPIGLTIWAVAALARGTGVFARKGASLISSGAKAITRPAVTAYKVYKTNRKAEKATKKGPKSTNKTTFGEKLKTIHIKLTVTQQTPAFTGLLTLLDDYIKEIPLRANPAPGQQDANLGKLLSTNNKPVPNLPLKRDISTTRSEYGEKSQALVSAFHNCLKTSKARSADCENKVQECLLKVNEQIKVIAASPVINEKDKALKKIEALLKECALEVAGISEKTFKKEYALARGIYTPPVLVNDVTANSKEVTRRHIHTFSMQYLQQRDPEKFQAQINFMNSHQDFLRVSELKKTPEMQGVAVNAHEHVLLDKDIVPDPNNVVTVDKLNENGEVTGEKVQIQKTKTEYKERRSVFRSGAFAVHGRHEERINILKEKIKELEKEEILWEIRKNREGYHPKNCQGIINETRQEIEQCKEQILGIKKAKNMGILSLDDQLTKFKTEEERINKMPDGDDKTKELNRLNKKLRKELGFKDMEEFRAEISMRRDFCISQALPELIASIMKSAENPDALRIALAAGNFLHVVEGLLSHLNGAERAMIEDMKGTLDYLSKNMTIKFAENQVGGPDISVNNDDVNNPKITVVLPMPKLEKPIPEYPDGFPKNIELGLTAICFNTAVNETHTLRQLGGVFMPGKYLSVEKLQDRIVADGLNQLQDYQANVAKKLMPPHSILIPQMFDNIRRHYSEEGSRDTKDMEGMKLRENFVKFLGGQLSVKCKSGKDRTGAKICQYFSNAFSREKLETRHEIKENFQYGISYHLTGINTGKSKAFAFNPIQQKFLPDALVLPEEVCGSAPS